MEVGYTEVEVPAVAPRYANPPPSARRLHVSDRQSSFIYLRDSFYLNLCSQSGFDKSRIEPSRKAQPEGAMNAQDDRKRFACNAKAARGKQYSYARGDCPSRVSDLLAAWRCAGDCFGGLYPREA